MAGRVYSIVHKFISGKYDINCSVRPQLHSCRGSGVQTRGNLYKLVLDRSKCELRITLFYTAVWNSLPDSVVSAESVNSFKSSLDKFWSMLVTHLAVTGKSPA